MKFLRKMKAKKEGMPFFLKDFWPPFYQNYGGKAPGKVLDWMYKARVGDVIPVFWTSQKTHYYRLKCIGMASGSDHVVSPYQFDLEYVRTGASV